MIIKLSDMDKTADTFEIYQIKVKKNLERLGLKI